MYFRRSACILVLSLMTAPVIALSAVQVDIVPGTKPKPTKPATVRPKTAPSTKAGAKRTTTRTSAGDLFPLHGVTLGKTTTQELARLGKKATSINSSTGNPFRYYEINEINFWYNDAGVADSVYLTNSWMAPDSMPERWQRLGWDWDLSYNSWIRLLRQQGYSITIVDSPRIIKKEGRDHFIAEILAVKRTGIPLEVKLEFGKNILDIVGNGGTSTDSKATLSSINVRAL
jgi:hypothetical protein